MVAVLNNSFFPLLLGSMPLQGGAIYVPLVPCVCYWLFDSIKLNKRVTTKNKKNLIYIHLIFEYYVKSYNFWIWWITMIFYCDWGHKTKYELSIKSMTKVVYIPLIFIHDNNFINFLNTRIIFNYKFLLFTFFKNLSFFFSWPT